MVLQCYSARPQLAIKTDSSARDGNSELRDDEICREESKNLFDYWNIGPFMNAWCKAKCYFQSLGNIRIQKCVKVRVVYAHIVLLLASHPFMQKPMFFFDAVFTYFSICELYNMYFTDNA